MRIEVDPIPGEAPLHNLMSTAIPLSGDPDNRWEQGSTWEQLSCTKVLTFRQVCNQTTVITGTGTSGGEETNDPNTYYMPYECQVDAKHQPAIRAAVEARLEIGTLKGLEADFWADMVNTIPNADGTSASATSGILNATFATPVAVTPEVALMAASQALGNCGVGAKGMIHAVPYLAEAWTQHSRLCEDDKGRLVTKSRGDVVVVGNGYLGTGPAGNGKATPDSGTAWMFVTPMVGVRASAVKHQSTDLSVIVNRSTNVVKWMAEQTAGYQVDTACCVFAILVDLP